MEKKHLNNLFFKLIDCKLMSKEEINNLIYSLQEIEESFDKIYNEIIIKILKTENTDSKIQDLIWDIREEFRHIDYHIKDGKLLDLQQIKLNAKAHISGKDRAKDVPSWAKGNRPYKNESGKQFAKRLLYQYA